MISEYMIGMAAACDTPESNLMPAKSGKVVDPADTRHAELHMAQDIRRSLSLFPFYAARPQSIPATA